MSVILLAVVLLARIEVGEFHFNPRYKGATAQTEGGGGRRRVTVIGSAELRSLRVELERWGLASEIWGTLELLYRAGLVTHSGTTRLGLTSLAYRWLQLPLPLAARLLLEAEPGVAKSLASLRAEPRFEELAGLLRLSAQGLATDDPTLLEAARLWQSLFPVEIVSPFWLNWQPTLFEGSIEKPRPLGQPATFDRWSLFRLLRFCDLTSPPSVGGPPGFKLARTRIQQVVAGQNLSLVSLYAQLESGLGRKLPTGLRQTIGLWLKPEAVYVVRSVLLLQASDRTSLQKLWADQRIRVCLDRIISTRHAVVKETSLGRLKRVMAQRNLVLQTDNALEVADQSTQRPRRPPETITLKRSQVVRLVAALKLLRLAVVEEDVIHLPADVDLLLSSLVEQLTIGEEKEANTQVAQYADLIIQSESSSPGSEIPPQTIEALRVEVEKAIANEQTLTIRYSNPTKPPTIRQIEPFYLEERGGYFYVLAYCYLRKAERLFRLDRIGLVSKE